MAKQLTDEELNIRRKARRRLVGAIALTLAVVVILPMVLDSEPKPSSHNIDLRIPSPNKVGEFVPKTVAPEVAEVSPPASSAVVTASAPVAAPDEQPETKEEVAADGFVVQIGAYSNADTAKQELDKLKKWGFRAYTEKSGDKIRVRVGPYPDRAGAEKASKLLKKHGLHPAITSAK